MRVRCAIAGIGGTQRGQRPGWTPWSLHPLARGRALECAGRRPAGLTFHLSPVELEEGPRMGSRVVGCAPGEVRSGMPGSADFQRRGDALLPFRRPAAAVAPA